MCGIVGFITTDGWKGARERSAFMDQGLIIDLIRGEDSTGLMYGYTLEPGCIAGFQKDAVDGYSFVQSDGYQEVMKKAHNMAFAIGHNRAATIGNISVNTAHPFKEGEVVGLHNGTVRGGMTGLPISWEKSGVKVDSHCIVKNLAHVDPDEALSHVISKIDGAYMLVWHDARDGSLNFARNDTRSFHIGQSYSQDTLYFASEAGQLNWLNERNHLGMADVVSLSPGCALKFTKEGGLKPRVKEFTPAPKWVAPKTTKAGAHGKPTTSSNGGTQSPGKLQKAPWQLDNRVLVGGKKRAVPQLLQEQLLELELAVEDRLVMTPMAPQQPELVRKPANRRYVTGFVDSIGMTALVYNVEQHVVDYGFKRRWSVRPVGVLNTDRAGVTQILICEMIGSFEGPTLRTLLDKKSSSTSSTKDTPKEAALTDGLPGPAGSCISTATWLNETNGGCTTCGKALIVIDAATIKWDEQTHEPQCGSCARLDDIALARMANEDYDIEDAYRGYSDIIH